MTSKKSVVLAAVLVLIWSVLPRISFAQSVRTQLADMAGSSPAAAPEPTSAPVDVFAVVTLTVGSDIAGRVLSEDAKTIVLDTSIGKVSLRKSDIAKIAYRSTLPKAEPEAILTLKNGGKLRGRLGDVDAVRKTISIKMGRSTVFLNLAEVDSVDFVQGPPPPSLPAVVKLKDGGRVAGKIKDVDPKRKIVVVELPHGTVALGSDEIRKVVFDADAKVEAKAASIKIKDGGSLFGKVVGIDLEDKTVEFELSRGGRVTLHRSEIETVTWIETAAPR